MELLFSLLEAMSLVGLTWLALAVVFVGLGLLLRRVFGLLVYRADVLLRAFWAGWALMLLFLQVWHLFFPVDWRVWLILAPCGLAGIAWNGRGLWVLVRRSLSTRYGVVYFLLLVCAVVVVANHSIAAPPLHSDSFLYHLQTIKWNVSYPIVRGLGNLHSRLAFNSSHFLYLASLEVGPWSGRSHHVGNGLLLVAVFAWMLRSVVLLVRERSVLPRYRVLDVLLLAPVVEEVLRPDGVATATSDIPVLLLGVVLGSVVLAYLEGSQGVQESLRENGYLVVWCALLASAGVTVKLSSTVLMGLLVWLVVGIWWVRDARRDAGGARVVLGWMMVLVLLLIVPWLVRNVVLSGYVLYPLPASMVPVAWRVPHDSVVAAAQFIRSRARIPDECDIAWE
jgi:hypothetical protein